MIDEILKKFNLKYEDLTVPERETLHSWISTMERGALTVEKVRDYLGAMKFSVEQALVDEPEFNYILLFKVPNRKQILLKARLKNYMLLEAFLSTPKRAKEAIERALAGIAAKGK